MIASRYQIIYHPLAEKEYLESISWYEDNRTGLSIDFITETEKVLNHIEANPFLYSIKKLKYREAPVKKFPYIIVYKINPKLNQIICNYPIYLTPNEVFLNNGVALAS